jgi:hypothetical protein
MSRAGKLLYGKFRTRKKPPYLEEPEPVWMRYKWPISSLSLRVPS